MQKGSACDVSGDSVGALDVFRTTIEVMLEDGILTREEKRLIIKLANALGLSPEEPGDIYAAIREGRSTEIGSLVSPNEQRLVYTRVFEIAIRKASKNIENGVNISTALKESGEFPPILIQLLATGEETGEIDGLALKASDFYTKQVNAIVDRLTSIIEPLLIVLVGTVIGGIVIVTYLPIFHFGEALAN